MTTLLAFHILVKADRGWERLRNEFGRAALVYAKNSRQARLRALERFPELTTKEFKVWEGR